MTHTVTRRGLLSGAALRRGVATLPEGVSWVAVGAGIEPQGERPTQPMHEQPYPAEWDGCTAALEITVIGTGQNEPWVPECTREVHDTTVDPLHVAHIDNDLPIAAWVDDPEVLHA